MTATAQQNFAKARAAAASGDHAEAARLYEWFFDHALDGDPLGLYGVRLAHGIREWAALGAQHPPALERLRQKGDEALALFEAQRDPERFHDYAVICRHTQRPGDPLARFLQYHERDRELAATIVRFVDDELIAARQWTVFATYLPKPRDTYARALAKFDMAMKSCDDNPSLGGEEFARHIGQWYVRDVLRLLLVLQHTRQAGHVEFIRAAVRSDMQARGRPQVADDVERRLTDPTAAESASRRPESRP